RTLLLLGQPQRLGDLGVGQGGAAALLQGDLLEPARLLRLETFHQGAFLARQLLEDRPRLLRELAARPPQRRPVLARQPLHLPPPPRPPPPRGGPRPPPPPQRRRVLPPQPLPPPPLVAGQFQLLLHGPARQQRQGGRVADAGRGAEDGAAAGARRQALVVQ